KVKKETAETAEIAETAEGAEQSEGQTAQQMQQQEQRLGTIAADLALRDQMVRDEYQVVRAQAQINAAEEARSVLMEYIIAAVENLRWEMIAEWWPEFVRRRQNLTTPFGRGLDDNLRRQWASHHTAQTNLITARVREAHRYLREARDQLRHPDPTRTADSVRDNLGQLRQQHAARITALRQSLAEADEQHNQDFVGRPELQAAGAAESHPQLQLDQVPVHSAWRPLMVNLLSEPAPGETDDSKDSNDRSNESEDDDNEARNKRD
ncbi:MAG: hypothetical protein LQ338_007829, partial [Usnochroma carphineum]